MTLVVSKIIDGKFINISDSLIMDRDILTQTDNPNKNPFTSILKTVILSQHVCVSYAGNVYYAGQCLKKILEKEQYTISELQDILIKTSKAHTKPEDRVDFALAIINKDGEVGQIKISNGNIIDHTNSLLWLGDSKAFSVFEKKFNELISSGMKEKQVMHFSFQAVIDNTTIDSVGHFLIRVCSDKRKLIRKKNPSIEYSFVYLEYFTSKLNKDSILQNNQNGEPQIPVDPENDLIGHSLFVTCSAKRFGIAVYSISEGKGLLLCPQLKLEPDIINFNRPAYKVVTGELIKSHYQKFLDEIYKKYRLPMSGLIWSSNFLSPQQISNFNSISV